MKKKLETDFKHWLRGGLIWSDTIEARGIGGGVGFPDLLALVNLDHRRNVLVPIECKIAAIDAKDNWKISGELRPAQIGWHFRFAGKGGTSALILGTWTGLRWRALIVSGKQLQGWKTGFRATSLSQLVVEDIGALNAQLIRWYLHQTGEAL